MRPLLQEVVSAHSPETLVESIRGEPGIVLLRSALFESPQARYSFVAAHPFLMLRSFGSRCELESAGEIREQFGNPWHILDALMSRYELLEAHSASGPGKAATSPSTPVAMSMP